MPPYEKLGEYRILGELGKGGMGVVYRAKQESLDREVALKVLPQELTKSEEFVKRFVREAKSAAHMVHPNVIQIYSVGEDNGVHYYAMEFVEGQDLSRKLKDGFRPTWEEATELVLEIAKALSCAEDKGIVHRDIKPANVMIDKHGQVKVMDFGLAKAFAEDTVMVTQPGMVVGTVAYMSPEQGKGEEIDGRADQYSLGIMYYELLTGRLPFKGDSPTAVLYMHIHEPPPPPRSINPTIPEPVERIALKLIAKKREERYPKIQELIQDLKRVKKDSSADMTISFGAKHEDPGKLDTERTIQLKGTSVSGPAQGGATQVGAPPSPSRKGPWIAAAAVAILAASGLGWLLTRDNEPAKDPGPVKTAAPIEIDLEKALSGVKQIADAAVSADRKPLGNRPWKPLAVLPKGVVAISLKRPFYQEAGLKLTAPAAAGGAAGIEPAEVDWTPNDEEVFKAVRAKLEEVSAGSQPQEVLAEVESQQSFVNGIYDVKPKPESTVKLLRRYSGFWLARKYDQEGKLQEAKAALEPIRADLETAEAAYYIELSARASQASTVPVPPVGPDPTQPGKRYPVNLALYVPPVLPDDAAVYFRQQPLPKPWPESEKLEPGRYTVDVRSELFDQIQATFTVGSDGTVKADKPVWAPSEVRILSRVRKIVAEGEGDPRKGLEQVSAARAFAEPLYQMAGQVEIPAGGAVRRYLEGREALYKATLATGEKSGGPEARRILAAAKGSLDEEGLALLERLDREVAQAGSEALLEQAKDCLDRGLLEEVESILEKDLKGEMGRSEVRDLQRKLLDAKALQAQIASLKRDKQYALAYETAERMYKDFCPKSLTLEGEMKALAQLKQHDEGAQEQNRNQIARSLDEAQKAMKDGDFARAAQAAQRILDLDATHVQAREIRDKARLQMDEAQARDRIQESLAALEKSFAKAERERDKAAYEGLFTPEGWKQQVERGATQFFDGTLALASSRFDDRVVKLDMTRSQAVVEAVWAVSARYGRHAIEAKYPIGIHWRSNGGTWKIEKIEARPK